jgi:hypothetical protein
MWVMVRVIAPGLSNLEDIRGLILLFFLRGFT